MDMQEHYIVEIQPVSLAIIKLNTVRYNKHFPAACMLIARLAIYFDVQCSVYTKTTVL